MADVVSAGWSIYDLWKNPSWANAGYLTWDLASVVIPFAPGSYVAKAGKLVAKGDTATALVKELKVLNKADRISQLKDK